MTSEEVVVGQGTEYPLDGLLCMPDSQENPVPGVVFVHGSGPSNKDEQIYKLTPFKDLAEGLAERGVASIRYDKRTFAHAKKARRNTPTVREETIADAVLAAELLIDDRRINGNAIYVVGHSMGAMLAPRIDAECGLFRGMVLMAGTPLRLEQVMLRQFRQAKESGSFLVRTAGTIEDRMFGKKFDGLYEMPDDEARRAQFAGGVTLYYFKEMGAKTTADYLLESEKPVLIMQGGMDFQVLASEDYELFRELLASRPNVEWKLYEDLNHLFVKGIYRDIAKASKEYKVERHIGPEVIDDIARFIHESSSSTVEQPTGKKERHDGI